MASDLKNLHKQLLSEWGKDKRNLKTIGDILAQIKVSLTFIHIFDLFDTVKTG